MIKVMNGIGTSLVRICISVFCNSYYQEVKKVTVNILKNNIQGV